MRIPGRNHKGDRRYGCWAGDPDGRKEDGFRCAAEIIGWPSHVRVQCGRKRGHGPANEFCKQHAKMIEKNSR